MSEFTNSSFPEKKHSVIFLFMSTFRFNGSYHVNLLSDHDATVLKLPSTIASGLTFGQALQIRNLLFQNLDFIFGI